MTGFLEDELSYNAVIRSVRYDPDGSNLTEGLTLAADVGLTLVENQVGFGMGADGAVPTGILLGDIMTFETTDYGTVSFDLYYYNFITLMQVTQPDGSISDVMTITHYHYADGTTTGYDILYLQVGGAELPAFASLAALDAWNAGAEWTVSPRYPEDTAVFWANFDNDPAITGTANGETVYCTSGDDLVYAGDGADTVVGLEGDDTIYGGTTSADLRDVIRGNLGWDHIDGGYGNDELYGDGGNDVIEGGFGADSIYGGTEDDRLSGSALGDLLFGGDGNDYLNGGFGFDRMNGGTGADRFFHVGVLGHGSDWIQDYDAAEGDTLVFGIATATRAQFQVNWANTANAGEAGVQEAFVVYRPTAQVIWALVDGAANDHIWLQIGGVSYDLLA